MSDPRLRRDEVEDDSIDRLDDLHEPDDEAAATANGRHGYAAGRLGRNRSVAASILRGDPVMVAALRPEILHWALRGAEPPAADTYIEVEQDMLDAVLEVDDATAGRADVDGFATSPLTSPRPRPGGRSEPPRPSPPPPKGGRGGATSPHDLAPEGDQESDSWKPIDLVALGSRPPEPPEIVGLFYLGLNHLLAGESEALKTWLALVAAVDELLSDRGVVWVDGDEVGAGAVLERLRLLGVDDATISARFAYIVPDEPLDLDRRRGLLELIEARSCRLVVLDGFNPLLVLHGLDPIKLVDVEAFYRLIAPVRRQGAAVVLTDNVVKSSEARGAWAIGSERKKSKAEVQLGMTTIQPLVRGGVGRAKITVHKDRPGFLTRPSPGLFVVDATGELCVWSLEEDTSRGDEGGFRPTGLMERVSRFLEVAHDPRSRKQIEEGVKGKRDYVRRAIDVLCAEGYAEEFKGERGARMVRLVRIYRVADEAEVERLAERDRAWREAEGE